MVASYRCGLEQLPRCKSHPAFGVDELRVYADLVARPPHAAFEDIADAQVAAYLLHVDRLALVRESSGPGDYETSGNPRQIAGQIVGNSVREIFLLGIIRQVRERENNDRNTRNCPLSAWAANICCDRNWKRCRRGGEA